jgi:hypothetical protein
MKIVEIGTAASLFFLLVSHACSFRGPPPAAAEIMVHTAGAHLLPFCEHRCFYDFTTVPSAFQHKHQLFCHFAEFVPSPRFFW